MSIIQQGGQSESKKHGILKTMMSQAAAAKRNTAKLLHYHENPGEALNKTGTEIDKMLVVDPPIQSTWLLHELQKLWLQTLRVLDG